MNKVINGNVIRFLSNQEIDTKNLKLKKLVFFDKRKPLECSVGIKSIQTDSEYKAIAQLSNSASRYFKAFCDLGIDAISNTGNEVIQDDTPFLGHANIRFNLEIEDNQPIPNKLKQMFIELQKQVIIMVDVDVTRTDFISNNYKVNIVNHKILEPLI